LEVALGPVSAYEIRVISPRLGDTRQMPICRSAHAVEPQRVDRKAPDSAIGAVAIPMGDRMLLVPAISPGRPSFTASHTETRPATFGIARTPGGSGHLHCGVSGAGIGQVA